MGDPGRAGKPGESGEPGPPGISDYQSVQSDDVDVAANSTQGGSVRCPQDTKVLGGGVTSDRFGEVIVNRTAPNAGDSWAATVTNTGSQTRTFNVLAICAKVDS